MVDIHVREPIRCPIATGTNIVVGDSGHGDLFGWSARTGDHVLDLVTVILVVPPSRHLVAGSGLLNPGAVLETHFALGRDNDARSDVSILGREAVSPDVRRFHDMVVNADDFREISDRGHCGTVSAYRVAGLNGGDHRRAVPPVLKKANTAGGDSGHPSGPRT